jgi:hypothetical protein
LIYGLEQTVRLYRPESQAADLAVVPIVTERLRNDEAVEEMVCRLKEIGFTVMCLSEDKEIKGPILATDDEGHTRILDEDRRFVS